MSETPDDPTLVPSLQSPSPTARLKRRVAEFADRGIALATSRPPMFSHGWGDRERIEHLLDHLDRYASPPSIEIRWFHHERTCLGLHYLRGYFPTPATSLSLPPQSRMAYVEMLLPSDALHGSHPPVCIHLAGTGDATYIGRRIIAHPLARRRNIGALILQNPYYGERQPPWQHGTKLQRVTDQFAMNIATLEETRSLVRWLHERGVARVGVTGYSMGGYIAALAAQSLSTRVAVIPCATGDRVVYPFVYSPLARILDWEALEGDLPRGRSARRYMRDLMSRFAISRHGTLRDSRRAIVLGARYDAFVLPDEVRRLHRHWPRSELRWMESGHTTGWLLHRGPIRDAIADAFEQLDAIEEASSSNDESPDSPS
jgi:pimeloyl-ACP methyl ester carboxylesterase